MANVTRGSWGEDEREIRFVDKRVVVHIEDPSGDPLSPESVEEYDAWILDTHALARSAGPLPAGYFVYEPTDREREFDTLQVIDDVNATGARVGGLDSEAFPDGLMEYHTEPPGDAGYAQQWALRAAGVEEAWKCGTGSSEIWLAIIDSGMPVVPASSSPPWDLVHPDLDDGDRFQFGLAFKAGLGHFEKFSHYGAASGVLPTDTVGHGSHVLGIMAAEAGNTAGPGGGGTVGVNWVSPVYVTAMEPMIGADGKPAGSGASQLASALEELAGWMVATPDAQGEMPKIVINISLGGEDFTNAMVRDALGKVVSNGAIVVASTGNSFSNAGSPPNCGGDVCAPAKYAVDFPDNVISVGAITRSVSRSGPVVAPWSNPSENVPNPGPVTVVAPGADIFSTTFDQGKPDWGAMEGTSQAAPLVAGIVSLYWSANPTQGSAQVVQAVKDSAKPLDVTASLPDRRWGFGRVDAKALICPEREPSDSPHLGDEAIQGLLDTCGSILEDGGDLPNAIPQAIWRNKVERCAFDLSENLLLEILEDDECGDANAEQLTSALWLKEWLGESDWDGTGRHSGGTT